MIEPERLEDERGLFARTWCKNEFDAHGLNSQLAQCSTSFNRNRGTLRGMHFQMPPHEESKIVRCTAGSIFDVTVDLRCSSPTFLQWLGVKLTAKNRVAVFVPEGCAHGFQTLRDDSEVFYMMSTAYSPAHCGGFRWNDPIVGITWPFQPTVLSQRDQDLPSVPEALKAFSTDVPNGVHDALHY